MSSSGNNNSGGRGGRGGRGRGGRGRGRGRGGRGRGGRGGGRQNNQGNDCSSNAGRPSQQPGPSSRRPPPAPPSGNKLKNGEKGADIHTVSESDRIRWTEELIALRESHWESEDVPPKKEFPPTLTNTERKFIHSLAAQLGLHSKSSGKGESRRIAIYPAKNQSKATAGDDLSSIPILKVGTMGVKALKQHFEKFPPSHPEQLESHETGSSLVEAMGSGNTLEQ